MIKKSHSHKKYFIALLVLVPLLLMFQGLDFTDTGWVLANYQQVFKDPASVSYWFHLWLPNIIGGLWNIVFGWGGLLSFKFAAVLIFWITAFCVYRAYRDSVSPECLFPALAAGMILHFPSKITVIHYNNVSMLFLTLGAVLLFTGIQKKSPVYIFLSGGAVMLAAFARISNILGMAFALVLVYDWIMEKGKPRELIKNLGFFFGGVIFFLLAVIVIMYALGHLQIYAESLRELFLETKVDYSHYTLKAMLKTFLNEWFKAVFYASLIGFGFFLAQAIAKKIFPRYGLYLCIAVIGIITAAVSWSYTWVKHTYITFPFTGIIVLNSAWIVLFAGDKYKKQKLLAVMSILLAGILSLGSDTGIRVSTYSLIFGFPLLFWYWFEIPETRYTVTACIGDNTEQKYSIGGNISARKAVIVCVLTYFTVYCCSFALRNVYRDSSWRWTMTKTVDTPLLRGVFTTPARAQAVNGLLSELQRYVRPGDIVLTYDHIPMLHYITRTKSYLYNPWPDLYLPGEFEKRLEKARGERPTLPITVLPKEQIQNNYWPLKESTEQRKPATVKDSLLYTFLEENGYKKVWENNTFEILAPPGE